MFVRRLLVVVVLVTAALVALLAQPRPTRGAAGEDRYVVRAGDTLWEIAAARYSGDPREGIWRIKERNGLRDSSLAPGAVLVLPAPP